MIGVLSMPVSNLCHSDTVSLFSNFEHGQSLGD